MTPESLFGLANLFALTGWLALGVAALSGRVRPYGLVWAGWTAPALLALLYAGAIAAGFGSAPAGAGFSSLSGVRALFTSDWALLAGWVHYLAFDMLVGAHVVREGRAAGVPGLLLLPCLGLTFLFGPVGFLLFLLVRAPHRRRA